MVTIARSRLHPAAAAALVAALATTILFLPGPARAATARATGPLVPSSGNTATASTTVQLA